MSAVVAYFNTQYVNIFDISDTRETTGAEDRNDDSDDPLATTALYTNILISLSKLGNFVNIRNFRHTFAHA